MKRLELRKLSELRAEFPPTPGGTTVESYGIQNWSPDDRWFSGFQNKEFMPGGRHGRFWITNRITGKVHHYAKPYEFHMSCQYWESDQDLVLGVKGHPEEGVYAVRIRPGKYIRPVRHLPGPPSERLPSGKYICKTGRGWLLWDPDGKQKQISIPADLFFSGRIKSRREDWLFGTSFRYPGLFVNQIVLLSADGSIMIPITTRPGGCTSPVFLPRE